MHAQDSRVGAARRNIHDISQLAGNSLELLVRWKSVNDNDDWELEAREVDVRLTDDRASFEVWPAPFAFPCSDVAAQLA